MLRCSHVRTIAKDTDTIAHQIQVNAALEMIGNDSIHTIQHAVTGVDRVYANESQQTPGPAWVYSTVIFYWERNSSV